MKKQLWMKLCVLSLAAVMAVGTCTAGVSATNDELPIIIIPVQEQTNDGLLYKVMDDGNITISGYKGTQTELTIPAKINGKTVTTIGEGAFSNSSLTAVTIPDTVREINTYAFSGCTALQEIHLSDSVEIIGPYAFQDTAWFDQQPVGGVYLGKILYACKQPASGNMTVTIKDDTKTIADMAFLNCQALTEITIPESVTVIGKGAFAGCNRLMAAVIPDSVTDIGESAFSGCTALTNAVLPKEIKTIPSFMFRNCSAMKSIALPDSISAIGSYSFQDCKALTAITIPSKVEKIGWKAFMGCTSLSDVKTLGSPSDVGYYAFENTAWYNSRPNGPVYIGTALYKYKGTAVSSALTIKSGTTSISREALYGCNRITSITIPDSVVKIDEMAFRNCTGLKEITFPNGVTELRNGVLEGCTELTSVILPAQLQNIAYAAFEGCTSLKSITIPQSAEKINGMSFANCKKLESALILGENTEIYNDAFYQCDQNFTIIGKKNSKAELYAENNNISFNAILTNVSELSHDTIVAGDMCKAYCRAEGGTGSYTSSVYYRKAGTTKWHTIVLNTKDNSVTVAPQSTGHYEVRVVITDTEGNVERKDLQLEVNKPLTNTSKLSTNSITLGSKVKVRCFAQNGTTPYTFSVQYKKASSAKWVNASVSSINHIALLKPSAATDYAIRVIVRSADGQTAQKYLLLKVTK